MSKMLQQQHRPTQAAFHNHGEVFTPPPAQESAARAESSGPSPPCTTALPGGSGVPSPFVLTGHVTSCGLRCPTVTPSTGHSLPSSGQPRSAKVRALREGQAGTSPSLAAAGRQEGQHQQHRSSRARPVSNRQQPPGTHSATGPACPKPTDSSAQRGQHTQSSGGCGIHPADFYLFKLL